MKKAAINHLTYILVFVLCCALLVSFGTFAASLSKTYAPITGVTVSGEFNSTFNKLDSLSSDTKKMQDKFDPASVDTSTGGASYNNIWGTIKLIFGIVPAALSMVTASFKFLPFTIPTIWIVALSICLIATLIIISIYLFFSRST